MAISTKVRQLSSPAGLQPHGKVVRRGGDVSLCPVGAFGENVQQVALDVGDEPGVLVRGHVLGIAGGDRFDLRQGFSKRVSDVAAARCLPSAAPDPEPSPASPAVSPEPADTPARRHAKRLFEARHSVTSTGRSSAP